MRHLLLAAFIAAFFVSCNTESNADHICFDPNHLTCDGRCECDGMACPKFEKKAVLFIEARDYQLLIVEDSVLMFDGPRLVGTLPMWDNSPLDSLIQFDND